MAIPDKTVTVHEGDDYALDSLQLTDEDGTNLALTDVSTITLTLHDVASGTILNSRNAQDILNTNGGTLTSGGVFRLYLSDLDNAIYDTTGQPRVELHEALVIFTLTNGVIGSYIYHVNVLNITKRP